METATAVSKKDSFSDMLKGVVSYQSGLRNGAFTSLRKEAKEHFERLGIPTTKQEEWKYTNLNPLLDKSLQNALRPEVVPANASTIKGLDISDGIVILLINGFLQPLPSSLSEGIVIKNIQDASNDAPFSKYFNKYADSKDDTFAALNTSLLNEGIYIEIKQNVKIEQPVYIINHTTSAKNIITQPRCLVVAQKGSKAAIEWLTTSSVKGSTSALVNSVNEIVVLENAHLDFCILENDEQTVSHVCNTYTYQEQNSHFNINTITMGGFLVKNKLHLMLDGQNIETHLFGLYMGSGKQHIDNHSAVFHAKPHCMSNQIYKGILDDDSTGVFNGKIFVLQDAQKTNAYQANKNILLSDGASMFAKPQLEIFADDVKCSHGATTGQMDEEALFYLRSRGIGVENAKALLNVAFAADVIQNIPNIKLREYILELIQNKLVKEA